MKTIVVPVVDTPEARRALEYAKEEARRTGAVIILVGTATVDERIVNNVEAIKDRLSEIEKELLNEGITCRTEWFVGESLGEATVFVAIEKDADLIAIGLRRRTPVGKALLGSFEQDILLNAPCPVYSFPSSAPLG